MRRKRIVIISAVALVGAGMIHLLRSDDAPSGESGRATQDGGKGHTSATSASEELERSSVRRSERKESLPLSLQELPEGWRGLDQTAVPPSPEVTKAAERVGKMMLDDEAARTKLVKEEKKEGTTVYRFEISRREDYNKYLDDLLQQEAKAAGVDAAMLGGLVRQNLKHLDIPQGHQQFVEIVVPLNPKEEASFKGFSMLPEEVGKTSDRVKIAFAGVVPIGAKEWRYSRLLDLGNP